MMEKQALLYEGKAKRIYQTEAPDVVWVEYKDEATAFNAEKKANITGKGRLNNAITSLLFTMLKQEGVPNHFIEKMSETEQIVKRVTIIPIEVVVRNVTAGSMAKRLGIEEGLPIDEPIVEFYYKNDELGDPLITTDHIRMMKLATEEQITEIREQALRVNNVLTRFFAEKNMRLIDFKLEFGVTETGELLLADEVSPDTCRLWDKETNQKLDKDVFRRDLGSLTDAYEEVLARLTH